MRQRAIEAPTILPMEGDIMTSTARTLVLFVLPAFLLACSDTDPVEPDSGLGPAPGSRAAVGAGFPLYGLDALTRATPGEVCDSAPYRDFDFWLGEWEVDNPEGTPIGTNSVTRELNGCVVAEHWTDTDGGRGRSINTFDPETGQWHQTWVSANFSGHLRMSGGLQEDGRMVLTGQREAVNQGVTLFDEYRWTPLGDGRVEQVGILRVPAADFEGTFVGLYERRDAISPAPEAPTMGCQPGGLAEQARQLDFWVGDWTVSAKGRVLGTSTVSTDLSGCLLEERFRTPKGYEAVAFAAFDVWEQRWFRTYIDNRGERVELAGVLEGNAMILTGQEAGPGESGAVFQRVRITPIGAGVRQSIQVSRDGGASWGPSVDLLYQPAGSREEDG